VQVHPAPTPDPSPFGLESQLQEVRRRLDDVERELIHLKARQAASETRDSTLEARLAELTVVRESLERSVSDIQRGLREFKSSVETQNEETRGMLRDTMRALSWRSVVMVVAAFFGGAALKLLEGLIPALSRLKP
jgi:septal ring factor EnvC (AmiA/AmiB activator)